MAGHTLPSRASKTRPARGFLMLAPAGARGLVLIPVIAAACGRIGFGTVGGGDAGASDAIQLGDGSRPDIVFTTNVVFVTTATVTPGSLGGLASADAVCQSTAVAASLPGTYIAWLSTSTTNAIDRLAGSRGWVRTDGVPFSDRPSDIAAGLIWSPISLLADGSEQAFDASSVVTGTVAAGTVANATNCSGWTAMSGFAEVGSLDHTIGGWTDNLASSSCSAASRIYCFGVGNQVPVMTSPPTGRRAFLSTAISSITSPAALDARCAQDASTAGVAGTFLAFIATSTTSAIGRFDTTGARWERLDGIPLAPSAAALAAGLRVPLNLHADGTYDTAERAWTGATDPASLASGASCVDWTSASPSKMGNLGMVFSGGANAFSVSSRRCDDSTHDVYCLEK
jgi:hypothetical protein